MDDQDANEDAVHVGVLVVLAEELRVIVGVPVGVTILLGVNVPVSVGVFELVDDAVPETDEVGVLEPEGD